MIALAADGSPWRRKRRCQGSCREVIREVKRAILRIDRFGMNEVDRARLVRALRALLRRDPWDGPFSAA